jgi:hypothetical protein
MLLTEYYWCFDLKLTILPLAIGQAQRAKKQLINSQII